MPNLYYEARGELLEPHTGKVIALGAREVESYRPDQYLYDKMLYVEKNGLRPVFEAVDLAARYDMGVMFGSGFANVAARTLANRLQTQRKTRIFVLHDADASGYNIAITLAEETARMPEHSIEIVDLGLTWGDAMAHGLTTETVTRSRGLPERLEEIAPLRGCGRRAARSTSRRRYAARRWTRDKIRNYWGWSGRSCYRNLWTTLGTAWWWSTGRRS